MGELALTRLQSGIEIARGSPVVATRKLYGSLAIKRDQPRRYADEDRGNFVQKYRANARLVDAGFSMPMDLTPEDFPYYLEMMLKGGLTGVPIGATGVNTWTVVPDQTVDSLKTRTFEWGDDSVSYRGAFATADQMDIAIPLDDAVRMTLQGWVEEWVPVGAEGFTGFTGSLTERTVETVMGWQQRLFIDPATGTIGTTQVSQRFVSAALSWRNQNKRKYFGDGSPRFQLLGRGERQIGAGLVAEAFDLNIVNDIFATAANKYNTVLPIERALRIMLIGSQVGTTIGSTSGATAAGTIVSLAVTALPQAIPGGTAISVGGVTFVVAPAGAASAATAIPVISQVTTQSIPAGAIFANKSIAFDYWGFWDGNPNWGNRDTNRTFQLMLQGVYDQAQAKEHQITIVNGLTTALGIS